MAASSACQSSCCGSSAAAATSSGSTATPAQHFNMPHMLPDTLRSSKFILCSYLSACNADKSYLSAAKVFHLLRTQRISCGNAAIHTVGAAVFHTR
jgi:hypothetical protein